MWKYQKLQFLRWPLEAGSKTKPIPVGSPVKMSNSTAEVNMFTAWYKQLFLSL